MDSTIKKNVTLSTFNCKNVTRSADYVRRLCRVADVIALQETWLLPHDVPFLGSIDDGFAYAGKSAVDTSAGVLIGRPYGGVALLWRKSAFATVSVVQCNSDRLLAIRIEHAGRSLLIFSVYMPTNSSDNLVEFTECLSEIIAITENINVESVFILGDLNAHPGERFSNELLTVCEEQSWSCVDMELLPKDTFTFESTANGALRWLDHCVVSSAARHLVVDASVLYGVYLSDHIPLLIECNIDLIIPKLVNPTYTCNKVIWGERDSNQINEYSNFCNSKLKLIDFPDDFRLCAHKMCSNPNHVTVLDTMYSSLVSILKEGAERTYVCKQMRHNSKRYIPGWNKYVRDAHREARLCYQTWLFYGKPASGYVYNKMCESRKIFKINLKYCQDNQQQIKMDILAKHHTKKKFGSFWKSTNSLNPKSSPPVSVAGVHEPADIANAFRRHFQIESPPLTGPVQVFDAGANTGDISVVFTAQEISAIINKMERGKSPGHDGLSIEHLRYAGRHLPRVLALLFNLCVSHGYLPDDVMYTMVVPIVKNKTGDVSDISNYRPISLATVIAKVLDSLLDKQLANHLELHDAQFGFKPGLSTESAIFCLKQTVQYYTDRKTPIFACFLDLSRAFDLVCYDVLWRKLECETKLPSEIVSIFKYWYSSQSNSVKWNGSHSDVYRLECGVRQGGLSSPRLFNLYMNQLILELSSTNVGCHIDGVCINNISYADDMVLLSPSICALRRLIAICEKYAVNHGLKYNVAKSELMVFKAGSLTYPCIPDVALCGEPLRRVDKFKYLGHWVTEDLKDNCDIERERRSLAVRCNMLARRFARCTKPVKVTLFKAYCQSFYTCSLWVNFTQRAYSDLRVQYNNALRVLLRLPWRCSASGMFADNNIDGFAAIIRKRCASLMSRVRGGSNSILSVFVDRWDSPMLRRWMRLHAEI